MRTSHLHGALLLSLTLLGCAARSPAVSSTSPHPQVPSGTQPNAQASPSEDLDAPGPDDQAPSQGSSQYQAPSLMRVPVASVNVDSEVPTTPKTAMVDGDSATRWTSRLTTSGTAWASLQLARSQPLVAIALRTPPSESGASYRVETSENGLDWTVRLQNQTNTTWGMESKALPEGTAGRFVRLVWNNGRPATPEFSIFEVRLYAEGATAQGIADMPPPPPWPRPKTTMLPARMAAAKLGRMQGDHTDSIWHMHAYLRIWYNGQRVEIPKNIGIGNGITSVMHTHDKSGTIHLEGPPGERYTLGQLFTQWGVPLKSAKVYQKGEEVTNPSDLILGNKMKLEIVFGRPPIGEPSVPLP